MSKSLGDSSRTHGLRRRRSWLMLLVVALLVTVVLVVLAGRVRSRSQAVADAGPPERSVLTEQVELRTLESSVVFRGTVGALADVPLVATAPAGRDPVVSATPIPAGAEVGEGTSVVEVAGRPVLVLFGNVPSYRDLRPGDSGPDVAQLEAALKRIGHNPGRIDGTYDQELAAAVEAAWRSAGYAPIEHAPGGLPLPDARRALSDAQARRATASTAEDRDLAAADVRAAAGLVAGIQAASGPMVPKGEVVFTPAFPVRVRDLTVPLGGRIEAGPVLTLASGPLAVHATIDEAAALAVAIGTEVAILLERTGDELRGTVAEVGVVQADPESGRRAVPLRIDGNESLPSELLGAEVRITTTTARSEGAVLVVPVAAVYSTALGGQELIVSEGADRERKVRVTAGVSSGGYVEVMPTADGRLRRGDRVVVGR